MSDIVLVNWAILKEINSDDPKTTILSKSKYSFGRAEDCEFKFPLNKLLSSHHCYIERDDFDKTKAWLVDSSTNGTLINKEKKIHKERYQIKNKDKIYLVYKKDEPQKNIGYEFEYLQQKKLIIDQTLAYNCIADLSSDSDDEKKTEVIKKSDESIKRKFDEKEVKPTTSKKLKESEENKEKNDEEINDVVQKKPIKKEDNDDFSDALMCSICSEIMHDCVSLQPCLHSFCAGCYSEWMEKSDECPICRLVVQRISKNHIVNNLIEAYLRNNPEKKRSQESLKELDDKNKITHDMLYPKNDKKIDKFKDDYDEIDEEKAKNKADESDSDSVPSLNFSDEENNEEEYNEDDDDENDEYVPPPGFAFNPPPRQAGFNYFNPVNVVNYNQPFRFTCRQCPQNKWANPVLKAPDYTCTPLQNHLLCQCCLEAFPDRNDEIKNDPLLPKQNCSLCFKAYCDLYWGCKTAQCKNCLTKFVNLTLDNMVLGNLINENNFESQLLSDWLVRKNKTIQDLLNECIQKVINGAYSTSVLNSNNVIDRVVCRNCGISQLKELAYQYRADIPDDEISDRGMKRPDCHWGKNCRTQKHNNDHAKRYNHICEQTKLG